MSPLRIALPIGLAVAGLIVTIMLPNASSDPAPFGQVDAALPDAPALHVPLPTIPAPGLEGPAWTASG